MHFTAFEYNLLHKPYRLDVSILSADNIHNSVAESHSVQWSAISLAQQYRDAQDIQVSK